MALYFNSLENDLRTGFLFSILCFFNEEEYFLFRNNDRNKNGSILVLLLFVVVFISIISLLMTHRFEIEMRKANTVVAKKEMTFLETDIKTALLNQKSCRRTFGGHDPNSTAAGVVNNIYRVVGLVDTDSDVTESDDIIDFAANVNETLAVSYGNHTVKIIGFELNSNSSNIGANAVGRTFLIVRMVGLKNSYSRYSSKKILVNVTTDSLGKITRCGVNGQFRVE